MDFKLFSSITEWFDGKQWFAALDIFSIFSFVYLLIYWNIYLLILGQQADAFNNPEANHEVERDDDEDEDAEETDSETEDTDETDGNTTTESNNSTEPSYPGYLVVGFNFITSFFTSLIPQGPRAVAQG